MFLPSHSGRAKRIGLILAVSATSALAQQKTPAGADDLRAAVTLMQKHDFPAAIEAYRKILEADPRNEKASLGQASAYYGIYNYDQTRRVLREAAAAHPSSAAVLVELGKLDIHLLHYDDAIAELKRAVVLDAASAAAHEQLGVAYLSKTDDEKALAEFNQAIRLAPGAASPRYFRGSMYADRNDNDLAYPDAKEAYRLEKNPQTQLLLAKAALNTQKCEETVELLKPLAEAETSDPANLILLSRAYKCTGQAQKAQELKEEFEEQSQKAQDARMHKMDADHLATQAGDLARKNQAAPAVALLEQALAEDPENGPSLAQLAKIDFSRGEPGKAQEEIAKALRGDPYNPDYLYVRGRVLEGSDPQGALEAFRQTVLVDPKESDAYFEMGAVYMKLGERGKAARAFRKAVEISPDDADYKRALADSESRKAR